MGDALVIRPPTKRTLAALEKVFAAEIHGHLPFQSRAAVFKELLQNGLIEEHERRFGTGWSSVLVQGYALTHAGRMLYCESCR